MTSVGLSGEMCITQVCTEQKLRTCASGGRVPAETPSLPLLHAEVQDRRGLPGPSTPLLNKPHLYLLHGEVQEGVVVADADQALGPLAAHAGAQAPVQLQHHQLV